jgi:hypothetical protein
MPVPTVPTASRLDSNLGPVHDVTAHEESNDVTGAVLSAPLVHSVQNLNQIDSQQIEEIKARNGRPKRAEIPSPKSICCVPRACSAPVRTVTKRSNIDVILLLWNESLSDELSDQSVRRSLQDHLHMSMLIPRECWLIIDSRKFQWLRNITQLGQCNLMYPGPNHTRFKHSHRTCHLAYTFMCRINAEFLV